MAVKMDEAAKRRVRAGRLLLKGKTPPDVVRSVGARVRLSVRWILSEIKVSRSSFSLVSGL